MGSKAFILLGLLFSIVLLISSEVTARDLAEETANEKVDANPDDHGGHGGHYGGGGHGGHYGGGGHGGGGRGGYGGGGGRCRYGCCRRGYHGECAKCCRYANEAVDAQPEAKPHN